METAEEVDFLNSEFKKLWWVYFIIIEPHNIIHFSKEPAALTLSDLPNELISQVMKNLDPQNRYAFFVNHKFQLIISMIFIVKLITSKTPKDFNICIWRSYFLVSGKSRASKNDGKGCRKMLIVEIFTSIQCHNHYKFNFLRE